MIDWASQARVTEGSAGDFVAVQRNDPDHARVYEIIAISPTSGEVRTMYASDPTQIGPLLHNHDEQPLAANPPPDWLVLVDSFARFATGPGWPAVTQPQGSYPLLLNLRTGDTLQLGPFAASDAPAC